MKFKTKSQRQLQIGENLKRVLSEIFLRNDVLTIPGSYITVLEADVSPDAKNVRIFIDIFGNEKAHDQIVKILNEKVPHFRFQLAKKLSLRFMPEMKFVLDRTEQKAGGIESLIAQESAKYKKIAVAKKSATAPKVVAKKVAKKAASAPKKSPKKPTK